MKHDEVIRDLNAQLDRSLQLAREMAGFVKSYGLDDFGTDSEWSRWEKVSEELKLMSARRGLQ